MSRHLQDAAEDTNAAALKERDRLWQETQKLRAAGKTAEAIAVAEAMLALERKVLPEHHADLAAWLGWLAEIQVEREELVAAKAARREALDILGKGAASPIGESSMPVGARRRRAPGGDGPGSARPVWPRRTGSTERSRTCTKPASTPKPFLRRVRPWRSARRCWVSATPTPPPA